jgi:hypothetical protein
MRVGTIGAVMDSKRFLSLVPGIDQGREGEQHRKNRSCESRWNPAQPSEMAYKFSSKSAPRTLHDVSLGQTKPYRPGQGLSEENIVGNRTFARVWFLCNKRSASSENNQALRVLIGCVGIRQQSRASIQQTSDACMLWHRREGDFRKIQR